MVVGKRQTLGVPPFIYVASVFLTWIAFYCVHCEWSFPEILVRMYRVIVVSITVNSVVQSVSCVNGIILQCFVFWKYKALSFQCDHIDHFLRIIGQPGMEAINDTLPFEAYVCRWHLQIKFLRVPTHTAKFWKVFDLFSSTWKVLKNDIGPEKSWKLKCRILGSPWNY